MGAIGTMDDYGTRNDSMLGKGMGLARKHDLMKHYCIMICGDYKNFSYCVSSSLPSSDSFGASWSCGMLGRSSIASLALSFQLVELRGEGGG